MNASSIPRIKEAIQEMTRLKGHSCFESDLTAYLNVIRDFHDDVIFDAIVRENGRIGKQCSPAHLLAACKGLNQSKGSQSPDFMRKYSSRPREEQLDVLSKFRRFGVSDQHGQDVLPRMMTGLHATPAMLDDYEAREAAGDVDRSGWRDVR